MKIRSVKVVPLPKAGSQAKSLVRMQIFRSLLYSFWQLIRFPIFLFTRQGFRNRISRLVKSSSSRSPNP
ncbi:hypothetical protein CBD41_01570 [bacterium TMED181]|nr:hypothetical protein [Planctomycetota bacterium]OUW47072.1 MAG: hypothetical protein CBD41_01570 [bacterium TMED181]